MGALLQTSTYKANINSATTTTLTVVPSTLNRVTVNTPVASATVKVYDATSATGTPIATISCPATLANPFSVDFQVPMNVGITVVTSGATDVTIGWS